MIRVGILIDSVIQPKWVASLLDEIGSCEFAAIVLVVENAGTPAPRKGFTRIRQVGGDALLYRLYRRFDRALAKTPVDPFEQVDVTEHIEAARKLQISPRRTKFSDYFEEGDIASILSAELDVALRFGFRILRGKALSIAKHGVWSYHHGDNHNYRGGPPGFWEVINGEPCFGTVLQVLSEDLDGGGVLYRSFSSVHPHSLQKSLSGAYWKTARFVMRRLETLHRTGRTDLESGVQIPYSDRLYRTPSNREMLGALGKLCWRIAKNHLDAAVSEYRWELNYAFEEKIGRTPLYRFKTVDAPTSRYWADPHVIHDKETDSHFIFFEEFDSTRQKGHISTLRLRRGSDPEYLGIALEQDCHLSYPFVFSWEGQYYMIPETSQRRRVELYRCDVFPNRWKRERTLINNVAATDATLVSTAGRYWLFVNIATKGASHNDELHLYFAETPLGPWNAHPLNPIKSDVRCARPAGPLFTRNGELYRPAQDCSRRYGHSITINKIVDLSTSTYRESLVGRIGPGWAKGLLGTHSISHAAGLTVVDSLKSHSKVARKLKSLSDAFYLKRPSTQERPNRALLNAKG